MSRTLLLSSGAVSPAASAAATIRPAIPSRPALASPAEAASSSGATPTARYRFAHAGDTWEDSQASTTVSTPIASRHAAARAAGDSRPPWRANSVAEPGARHEDQRDLHELADHLPERAEQRDDARRLRPRRPGVGGLVERRRHPRQVQQERAAERDRPGDEQVAPLVRRATAGTARRCRTRPRRTPPSCGCRASAPARRPGRSPTAAARGRCRRARTRARTRRTRPSPAARAARTSAPPARTA